MGADRWLIFAAYGTWLVCGVPLALELSSRAYPSGIVAAAVGGFLLFGLAFWLNTGPWCGRMSRGQRIALLALQLVGGLSSVAFTGNGLPGATLVIIASQLPSVFAPRAALWWIAAQSLLLVGILLVTDGRISALAGGTAFAGFQIFAIATSWLAHSESLARQALARSNAELTATRELLAENSRESERLRIARDLHDTLGHHLTALSIQLEVATRLSQGAAADHIREAHAVARLLLGDVRDVVSRLRESRRLDLTQALRALAAATTTPRVHLDVPPRLDFEDSAQAHALLRCVQEIITNAARHAGARNLWVTIVQQPAGIELHARDDGRGAARVEWGNGLRGMRERFEEYAGRIEVCADAGGGFEVRGFMPRPEAA